MCILLFNFFINFYGFVSLLSKGFQYIQLMNGLNFFDLLFPFDSAWAFLDYIWALILSNKLNTFIFLLVLLLGIILWFLATREIMTWFLQTKKIAKQNKLLIKQTQVLMDKIEAMSVTLNHIKPFSPFAVKKTDIDMDDMDMDRVSKKTSLISDIDDPLVDIDESSVEKTFPKGSSLDT